MTDPSNNLRTVINPDGAAILDIPRNQITTLNATGAFIWDKLQHGLAIDQVIRELAAASSTDPMIVETDVHSFLEQLRSKQLL